MFPTHPHKDQSSYPPTHADCREKPIQSPVYIFVCGIFKALNANRLKIKGGGRGSPLCKCEICKYSTPCPSYRRTPCKDWCVANASICGIHTLCPQREWGAWAMLSVLVYLGSLTLSGKSRSHSSLAPWGSSSHKDTIITCTQTPWGYLWNSTFHFLCDCERSTAHLNFHSRRQPGRGGGGEFVWALWVQSLALKADAMYIMKIHKKQKKTKQKQDRKKPVEFQLLITKTTLSVKE